MSERERFERWAEETFGEQFSLERTDCGDYIVSFIDDAWLAWQARADLAAEEKRELESKRSKLAGMLYAMIVDSDKNRKEAKHLLAECGPIAKHKERPDAGD